MTKKRSPAYRASKEETIPINKLHPFSNHLFHIALQARVLAWEAGEQWVPDAFKKGKDLYCATASRMFHR